MNYIKTYEKWINTTTKIKDYVVWSIIWCIRDKNATPMYAKFLANNIAKIIDDMSSDMASKTNGKPFRTYEIKYPIYKLPKWFKDAITDDGIMTIWDSEIVKFSKDKKELLAFIAGNKYNL